MLPSHGLCHAGAVTVSTLVAIVLVAPHAATSPSSSAICSSRVCAAANSVSLSCNVCASGVPMLIAARKSLTAPDPCISGSAAASLVIAGSSVKIRKKLLEARSKLPESSGVPLSPVVPSVRTNEAVHGCVLPLPRFVSVASAVTEMLEMPKSASVLSSLAWLKPSWFRSCQMRNCANAASCASIW